MCISPCDMELDKFGYKYINLINSLVRFNVSLCKNVGSLLSYVFVEH